MSNPIPLGEALAVIIDHRGKTPRKLGGDFTAHGVPVVSAIHVKNGRIDWSQRERFVSESMFHKWMPVKLKKNDLLLTSEAPLGEVALVPDDRDLVLSQRLFALRGKPDVLHTPYLYYYFRTPQGQADLQSRASGSTVLGIRQSQLVKIELRLPPLIEQRRIARVLGAFDDLVELNRLHIEHLMALSSALYSLVRRRATKTLTFGDVAEVRGGGTPSTRNPAYWGGPFAWATPTDVTRLLSPYLFRTDRTLTPEGLDACASRLYPVGSILMTSRATIGALALNQVPVATNQGFLVVLPRADSDRYVLFHEMLARVSDFKAHANGSTFLELSRGRFKELLLPWPDNAQREAFHARVAPLHEMACALEIENADLRRTRDELLPLLMSGAVRVSEVEDSVP